MLGIILLFSCSSPEIMKILKTKKVMNDKSIDKKKNKLENIEKVKPEELVGLFYDTPEIIPKSEKKKDLVNKTSQINPADYTIIIDWMVEGVRYIKIKNNKTGQLYIVKEGDKDSNIILLYRDYFKYRFRIDGTEVEIKR